MYLPEEGEFGDIKGVIRIRKSKKSRQQNGQKKTKDKMTNNYLQSIHIKLKIEITRTPLNSGGELMCFGRVFHKDVSACTKLDICIFKNS